MHNKHTTYRWYPWGGFSMTVYNLLFLGDFIDWHMQLTSILQKANYIPTNVNKVIKNFTSSFWMHFHFIEKLSGFRHWQHRYKHREMLCWLTTKVSLEGFFSLLSFAKYPQVYIFFFLGFSFSSSSKNVRKNNQHIHKAFACSSVKDTSNFV